MSYQYPYIKVLRAPQEIVRATDHNKQEEQLEALTDALGNYDYSAGEIEIRLQALENVTGGGGGGGGGGTVTLDELTDVNVPSPTEGQALIFTAGIWTAQDVVTDPPTLETVLATGNITNGNNIVLTTGDFVHSEGTLLFSSDDDIINIGTIDLINADVNLTLSVNNNLFFNANSSGPIPFNDPTNPNLDVGFTSTSVISALNELFSNDVAIINDLNLLTLSDILSVGNTTGGGTDGNDIVISTGDSLVGETNLNLTANDNIIFNANNSGSIPFNDPTNPNLDVGFASTSIISALNELYGNINSLSLTEVLNVGNITGGNNIELSNGDVITSVAAATTTSNGYTTIISGGPGGTTSGNGGDIQISGGLLVDGDGGGITIVGSNGVGLNRNGGSIVLSGGDATDLGTAGNITLLGGSKTNSGGNITILGGGASGTNISGGQVSIGGGAGNGNNTGGPVNITSGAGGATGNGAAVTITGGAGGSTSGNAGAVTIQGGTPTDGNGANVNIYGSNGVGASRTGGSVLIIGGSSTSAAAAGGVSITAGAGGGTGTGANVVITSGDGGTISGNSGQVIVQSGAPQDGNGGNITVEASAGVGTGRNGGNVFIIAGQEDGGTPGSVVIRVQSGNSSDSAVFGFVNNNPVMYSIQRLIVHDSVGPINLNNTDDRWTIRTNRDNASPTSPLVYNLPEAQDGLEYEFFVYDNSGIEINTVTGDEIWPGAAPPVTTISSYTTGSRLILTAAGTVWFAVITGIWEY